MLELPEVLTLASQLECEVVGREVLAVLPPNKRHKFCWYLGEPETYEAQIKNSKIESAEGFGIFAELRLDNGKRLCVNDGVNVRLLPAAAAPKSYQLLLRLSGGVLLAFTVAMYGGIILHDGDYDNEYYRKSREAVSPFSQGFEAYFRQKLDGSKPSLSVKAFLATEQRFPGIGNGVLQDILFCAGLHPKRKLATLGEAEREKLAECVESVLREMVRHGGRDTEKDLYGQSCGYRTRMSKNVRVCSACGGPVIKEAYLGGSVYYCPVCQPI